MARKRKGSWVPRWLRHRTLAAGEAILLVGACNELIQQVVSHLDLPNWGKVLWVMGSTLGLLGVMLLIVRLVADKSVAKTHEVVQAIPLPLPYLLVHALIYGGLFLLYSIVWKLPVLGAH
jgi:hypothetical protein